MFDFVHKNRRVVQVLLALITLPFAFWGVDSYFRDGGSTSEIASVAGDKITQNDFEQSLREQQDRMRQQLGQNYDPAVFDNPEIRFSLLQQLIDQRLMADRARRDRFIVSDGQLAQFIGDLPAFQEEGKFSRQRYEQLLAGQNMTPLMFEQRLRQDLRMAPLQEPIATGNIVAQSSVARYVALLDQKRDVAVANFDAETNLKNVKVDDAEVRAFYDANQGAFKTPEQVKIETITLSPDALSGQIAVDPKEVRAQYDANVKQYTQPEQRQPSHILIAVKPDAKDEDKEAARKKAESLLAQARKNPAQFADLAKKNSEDPGSAPQGGDLGFIAKDGSMVKPFEDAVFDMKPGDIAGPISTEFGWHIIKLTNVRPAKVRSFDEVKAEIEQDLKRQKASKRLAEAAEQFQNLVYEQADSLAPVAKALNLPIQTSALLSRSQVQALGLNNAKFVQSVFSPDSLQSKRNTEAIEVGPNVLMAARVVDYKPSVARPFDEVKAEIRRQLERKAATDIALKTGQEKLALLEAGKDKEAGVNFGKPVTLTRTQVQPGFAGDALNKIFQAAPAKLPAYVGLANERGGYSIYKIVQVITPPVTDPARLATFSTRVDEQVGRELMSAYLASLKEKAAVKINQAALDKK